MAKNVAFNEDGSNNTDYYDVHDASRSDKCYEYFHQLETTYFNTNFYDEILDECSVFSYYVAN